MTGIERIRIDVNIKAFIPPKWRIARSRLINRLRQSASHFEERERRDFFRRAFRALQFNGITRDYAKCGCCGGMTFGLAHAANSKAANTKAGGGRRLWAFDSFEGLPSQEDGRDSHPMWVAGKMSIPVLAPLNLMVRVI